MFKTLRIIGVLASAWAAYSAENSHYVRVNVPFAFVAAGQQFAPGAYNVTETESGVVTVQGEGKAAMVISTPLDPPKVGEGSALRFVNSNNRIYLSGLSVGGEGSRLVPVHLLPERKLAMTGQ